MQNFEVKRYKLLADAEERELIAALACERVISARRSGGSPSNIARWLLRSAK
jgi:hypothetical protein